MSKRTAVIVACAVLGSIFSFSVQAFPVGSVPAQSAAPDVMQVRGFCGLGFHRAYGYCVRNGTPYVAPPVVVAPPVMVAPPVCPLGYYYSASYGRCLHY
jgi:hypothetical protein